MGEKRSNRRLPNKNLAHGHGKGKKKKEGGGRLERSPKETESWPSGREKGHGRGIWSDLNIDFKPLARGERRQRGGRDRGG